jgi:hypothetical protein
MNLISLTQLHQTKSGGAHPNNLYNLRFHLHVYSFHRKYDHYCAGHVRNPPRTASICNHLLVAASRNSTPSPNASSILDRTTDQPHQFAFLFEGAGMLASHSRSYFHYSSIPKPLLFCITNPGRASSNSRRHVVRCARELHNCFQLT